MNKTGKEWLTMRMADTLNKLFANQKLPSITLEWKECSMMRDRPETTEHKESDVKIEQEEVKTSSRIQQQPGKMDTFFQST